ncbi:melanoma-associated antigen B16-like [Manis pentadactyla]|uniref:melanoma-associated antigen B16-like n=1 Tax=Manis pentadactyla TaxID=143292 RepID=UPI00255C9301|nr:melanoma-associated antigen B16-like [Manis pentadactyla]
MSLHQKNPQRSRRQSLQTRSETQGLQAAQTSEALVKTRVSSPPLMPGSSKGAPAAGVASTREGAQGFLSSPVAITATSSSRLGVRSSGYREGENTAQAAPEPAELPLDTIDMLVTILVGYMLKKYRMKETVTMEDIFKVVSPVCNEHFRVIFANACQRLHVVFGLDMKAVDPPNHRYELVISLGLTYDGMLSGQERVPKTGVLIVVLGVILMKGNRATEREVWRILNAMGMHAGRVNPFFGEPRKLITNDLVKEKYLEYRQVANSDPAQFEFLWGPRAYAETTKMKVLKFLARVNGVEPSAFQSQYEDALQDEEKRARATMSASAASLLGPLMALVSRLVMPTVPNYA